MKSGWPPTRAEGPGRAVDAAGDDAGRRARTPPGCAARSMAWSVIALHRAIVRPLASRSAVASSATRAELGSASSAYRSTQLAADVAGRRCSALASGGERRRPAASSSFVQSSTLVRSLRRPPVDVGLQLAGRLGRRADASGRSSGSSFERLSRASPSGRGRRAGRRTSRSAVAWHACRSVARRRRSSSGTGARGRSSASCRRGQRCLAVAGRRASSAQPAAAGRLRSGSSLVLVVQLVPAASAAVVQVARRSRRRSAFGAYASAVVVLGSMRSSPSNRLCSCCLALARPSTSSAQRADLSRRLVVAVAVAASGTRDRRLDALVRRPSCSSRASTCS